MEELREAVEAGEPALERLADQWGGLVKPDITFFGEARASPWPPRSVERGLRQRAAAE